MAIMDTSTGPDVSTAAVAVAVAAVMVSTLLWVALVQLVWRPYAAARAFGRQGIRGPAYRFLAGNIGEANAMRAAATALDRRSHDIIPRVLPHYHAWMSRYGKVFVSWTGPIPALCVGDYAMAKEILADRTGAYGKPDPGAAILALFGNGLVFLDGDDWARHRRVVHPAFAMDKLKTMTGTMAACAREMIRAWEARAAANNPSGEIEIEVGNQFQELTADVISHTAFGSSYLQGKEVFEAQRELQAIAMAALYSIRIPGIQYIPTKSNVRRRRLEKKVRGTLMAMIHERQAAVAKEGKGYGNDLLGLMLEANVAMCGGGNGARRMTMDEIVDECKTFFFAGHDTTSHLLTWAMFLLGTHLDWQDRVREEVLRECGGEALPDGDVLGKLKLVTMVLYETLRLYSPVSMLVRMVTADANLSGIHVPKGTLAMIPVAILHRDVDAWGDDAGEFNPLRFRGGVNKAAAHAGALLAFSLGHRSCIGQDFALLEAKAMLAMILRRFAFEVSPEYVHAPLDFLTMQPQCGLPMVLKLLD
uniref:Cytochrome P450 n=1 Tax=Leersia perrieri TaxID=77586 RepID=A0A0D9WMT2_9ORYZ